jgi:hypothetical protein
LVPILPIAEPYEYGLFFLWVLGLTFFLGAYSFCRFLAAWLVLKRMLSRIALPHPPKGLTKRLSEDVGWTPMKSFAWQIPYFTMTTLMADQFQSLAKSKRIDASVVHGFKENLLEAIAAEKNNYFEVEVQARSYLRQTITCVHRQLGTQPSFPAGERLGALRLISYLRFIFAHLRGCLIAAGVCLFPLLAAASTYAFEPNEFVTNWIWASLLLAILITVWVFFEMNRDPILSLISGTTPGEVDPDWNLVTNIVTYGVVPLLGLIASQFPQVGRYLVGLANPLLRAVGGG